MKLQIYFSAPLQNLYDAVSQYSRQRFSLHLINDLSQANHGVLYISDQQIFDQAAQQKVIDNSQSTKLEIVRVPKDYDIWKYVHRILQLARQHGQYVVVDRHEKQRVRKSTFIPTFKQYLEADDTYQQKLRVQKYSSRRSLKSTYCINNRSLKRTQLSKSSNKQSRKKLVSARQAPRKIKASRQPIKKLDIYRKITCTFRGAMAFQPGQKWWGIQN